MNLSRHPGPLRSRFGRRLLLLFVGCAVIPTAVVATVSYRHVTQYLIAQSETRLHQASKTFGAAIFERLLLLDATLKNIAAHAILQPPAAAGLERRRRFPGSIRSAGRRFTALEFVGDDGVRVPLSGRLAELPRLTERNQADLAEGLPLLAAERHEGRPTRTYLVRRVAQGADRARRAQGLLIGEINADYLWATFDQSLIAAGTILTVKDDSGHVLMSSVAGVQSAFQALGLDARPDADSLAQLRPRAVRLVHLADPARRSVRRARPGTSSSSHSREEVLGPVVRFTDTLLIVVLVSTAVVLVLSVDRIRRSLLPLRELQEGTRRIAAARLRQPGLDPEPGRVRGAGRVVQRHGGAARPAVPGAGDRRRDRSRRALGHRAPSEIVATLLARLRDVYPCAP